MGGRWEQGEIKIGKGAFWEILKYTGLLKSFCNSQTDTAGRQTRPQNVYLLGIYAVRLVSSLDVSNDRSGLFLRFKQMKAMRSFEKSIDLYPSTQPVTADCDLMLIVCMGRACPPTPLAVGVGLLSGRKKADSPRRSSTRRPQTSGILRVGGEDQEVCCSRTQGETTKYVKKCSSPSQWKAFHLPYC